MEILYFCPRWGSEHLTWADFCQQARTAGFDGIEAVIPFDKNEQDSLRKALKNNDLKLIGHYHQSFEKDFDTHKINYEKHLRNILSLAPLLIDSQTGKDYFTAQQNAILFNLATALSAENGIAIAHETHRNKALFAAHIAADLLKANPSVRITADFSHWVCVAESLLEDQTETLDVACQRAIHIHARVGHTQGAQVNDPRAAEWQDCVATHLSWWKKIVANRQKENAAYLTITPEFGPTPYMPALPHSQTPVANQWDVNVYMMEMLRGILG
jgi:sugar phosphate isomerase/epimerase